MLPGLAQQQAPKSRHRLTHKSVGLTIWQWAQSTKCPVQRHGDLEHKNEASKPSGGTPQDGPLRRTHPSLPTAPGRQAGAHRCSKTRPARHYRQATADQVYTDSRRRLRDRTWPRWARPQCGDPSQPKTLARRQWLLCGQRLSNCSSPDAGDLPSAVLMASPSTYLMQRQRRGSRDAQQELQLPILQTPIQELKRHAHRWAAMTRARTLVTSMRVLQEL